MRLAPFALLALFALPACEPYGYGYSGTYGGPVYGAPAPVYGSPYYSAPAYVPPVEGGVLLFGGDRDRRAYDRRGDDRRVDDNRRRNDFQRGQEQPRPVRAPPPQQRPAPVFAAPPGGGGGRNPSAHAPDFDPANPGAHGGGDH